MTLNLNQFEPNEAVKGLYVFMPNQPQLHNAIVGASQTLHAGDFVKIDTTATNVNATVVVKADDTDLIFGVVTFNPIKNTFTDGDRIAIAQSGATVFLKTTGVTTITSGMEVFDGGDGLVSAAATTKSVVGRTITAPDGNGFVKVELGFRTPNVAYVPETRTINGHALSANITLTASDVGAEPAQN